MCKVDGSLCETYEYAGPRSLKRLQVANYRNAKSRGDHVDRPDCLDPKTGLAIHCAAAEPHTTSSFLGYSVLLVCNGTESNMATAASI